MPSRAPGVGPVGGRAASLLALQRLAGNRAVAATMVQRHALPSAEDWTPSATVPEPRVITATTSGGPESAVGTPVAPPAPARGGATAPASGAPAAAPAIESNGLHDPRSQARMASAAMDVKTKWATLRTPMARASALGKAVNVELKAAKVPAPTIDVRTLGPGTMGQFSFKPWTLVMSPTQLTAATADLAVVKDATDTAYHEGRHAEQWFRMAQYFAGTLVRPIDPRPIASRLQIPAPVALKAAADPIAVDDGREPEARAWYDSVYGTNGAKRNAVYKEMDDADVAYDAAVATRKAAFKANSDAAAAHAKAQKRATSKGVPTEAESAAEAAALVAWQGAWAALEAAKAAVTVAEARTTAAFNAYQALPEEIDARAQASEVLKLIDLAANPPAPAPAPPAPTTAAPTAAPATTAPATTAPAATTTAPAATTTAPAVAPEDQAKGGKGRVTKFLERLKKLW
jgi:hypothetical protein